MCSNQGPNRSQLEKNCKILHLYFKFETSFNSDNLGQNLMEHPFTPAPPFNVGDEKANSRRTIFLGAQHCSGGMGVLYLGTRNWTRGTKVIQTSHCIKYDIMVEGVPTVLSKIVAVPILLIPWTFGEFSSGSYQNHTGPHQLLVQSLVLLPFVKYSTPNMPACACIWRSIIVIIALWVVAHVKLLSKMIPILFLSSPTNKTF